MMRFGRVGADASGATAIEYAIIAGLIGLGLVGSLVGTRGSLSSVFGTASSKMGSSVTTSTSNVPASPSAGEWATRGLKTATVTAQTPTYKTTRFTFNDGSFTDYTQTYDGSGAYTGDRISEYKNGFHYIAYFDPSGVQSYWQKETFYSGTVDYRYWGYPNQGNCGTGNWCGSYERLTMAGDRITAGSYTVPASELTITANDGLYFRGLANQ